MKYYIFMIWSLGGAAGAPQTPYHGHALEDIMKRALLAIACFMLICAVSIAQEKKGSGQEYALISEKLEQQGKVLDAQIFDLTKKISEIIKKYDLLKTAGIRVIPYQTTFSQGSDFIMLEKYSFMKDDLYEKDIVGMQSKKIKIYTNGQSISKIESEIYEHNTWSGATYLVKIVDTSSMSGNTDNIVFTHIENGKTFLENKKLADIKNTTAYPIRNELKREFLIPNLSYFQNSLLFIAESYYKGLKDSEAGMTEFLKKAKKY